MAPGTRSSAASHTGKENELLELERATRKVLNEQKRAKAQQQRAQENIRELCAIAFVAILLNT